jgi:hypothetical protein
MPLDNSPQVAHAIEIVAVGMTTFTRECSSQCSGDRASTVWMSRPCRGRWIQVSKVEPEHFEYTGRRAAGTTEEQDLSIVSLLERQARSVIVMARAMPRG